MRDVFCGFLTVAVAVALLVIGAVFGAKSVIDPIQLQVEKCRKEHNVYSCDLIAVPAPSPKQGPTE